jgi:putative ABC transport system substrate-binding protein
MNKRDLITLLGAAAAAWPFSARAQQQGGKLPTIGFLGTGTASGWQPWISTFVQRLRSLGWSEGRTVALEYRWGEGRRERFAEIAAEFVRMKVDIIVSGGSAVPLLKQATSVVPIVFVLATDPVGGGLVASLSRPGGNVTGLSNQGSDLAGGRLEILHEVTGLRPLAWGASAQPGRTQEGSATRPQAWERKPTAKAVLHRVMARPGRCVGAAGRRSHCVRATWAGAFEQFVSKCL